MGVKCRPPLRPRATATPSQHFPLMRVPVKVPASPPLKPPGQLRFLSPLQVPVVPLTRDAPRPPPPPLARGTRLSLYFSAPPPRPLARPAGQPARARARAAPAPSRARAGRRRGGAGGGRGGARAADVGLALSRSLPGGRAGTRTVGRARGRPGGGSGSRRRWLHFPRLSGGHSSSRGHQPREPELERPGAAAGAAAALRVSPGGRERSGDRRGRAVRCVVRGSGFR